MRPGIYLDEDENLAIVTEHVGQWIESYRNICSFFYFPLIDVSTEIVIEDDTLYLPNFFLTKGDP